MKSFFLLFILLLTQDLYSQVQFNKTNHDFGELASYSSFHVDFLLTNLAEKKAWILKIETPDDVNYIRSKESIERNDTIALRLHVSPNKEGKFRHEVLIYTSDKAEPTKVYLTGKITEIVDTGESSFTQCPTFDELGAGSNPNQFNFQVITIDKVTKKEIPNTSVTMIQNGLVQWTEKTNSNGRIKEPATLGLSYFEAIHPQYLPADMGAYINFKRKIVVIELEKRPAVTTVIVDSIPEIPIETPVNDDILVEFQNGPYKPINVVFVLDVSSSMRHDKKLELMKFALNELTGQLRDQDQIGIVTYSSSAKVIINSTHCNQSEEIINEVKDIKAGGYTAGGDGIKLGFKTALKGISQDGVSHIIVITDGAFNRGDDDYKKHIKKYAKKGIAMSVVGHKS